MKRHLSILIVMAIVFALFTWTPAAVANDDLIISGKITSMTEALTKKAKVPYIRFIVKFDKQIGSVVYSDSMPFMAFGTLVEPGRTYKEGQDIEMVVKPRMYEGSLRSYTILGFVKPEVGPQASN